MIHLIASALSKRSYENEANATNITIDRGLPDGFLLLWYSVLFTVESLSLLHLLVIS